MAGYNIDSLIDRVNSATGSATGWADAVRDVIRTFRSNASTKARPEWTSLSAGGIGISKTTTTTIALSSSLDNFAILQFIIFYNITGVDMGTYQANDHFSEDFTAPQLHFRAGTTNWRVVQLLYDGTNWAGCALQRGSSGSHISARIIGNTGGLAKISNPRMSAIFAL